MDNSYQTFEYVPASEPEADSNHFFIVEDSGNYFTLNRQEQIVLQVQGVNEVSDGVNPCTVYDVPVSSQQFFVDNPTELITSDQFILPEVNTNLFSQNFLLQQIPSVEDEQLQTQSAVETDNDTQIQTTIDSSAIDVKEELNNCAEITLTDEQYKILEKKGWLLLESNEKIFVLDNLGLHDITDNEKLIQKLREDLNTSITETNQQQIEYTQILNADHAIQFSTNNETKLELLVDETQTSTDSSILHKQLTLNTRDIQPGQSLLQNSEDINTTVIRPHLSPELKSYKNTHNKVKFKPKGPITIKTNFIFRDIPDILSLGKTPSGRNMVAKVQKSCKTPTSPIEIKLNDELSNMHNDTPNNKPVKLFKKEAAKTGTNYGLSENEFEKLVQDSIRSNIPANYEERAALIEPVILQLFEVDSCKPVITDRNLVVTKITQTESRSKSLLRETKPILVSGRLAQLEDGRRIFVPLPYMLPNVLKQSVSVQKKSQNEENVKDVMFTHIHIVETKREGAPVRNSITINKKSLSAKDINKQTIVKYMCPACASVFWTKEELDYHIESNCIDPEGDLTIDTGLAEDVKCIVKTNKLSNKKTYMCTLCKSEFQYLANCQRHLKVHQLKSQNEESNGHKAFFKCNLCPSVYIYSSSLSKHILKDHIKNE